MRTLIAILVLTVLVSCSKDEFTNEPQIEFKGFDANQLVLPIFSIQDAPKLKFEVRDGDGDLGFVPGQDTSFIYLKNLLNGVTDSAAFPNLGSAAKKNFKGDVEVGLFGVLRGRPPGSPRPYVDTLFFEVYVKDFAKNKSNVIVSGEPFYLVTP